MYGLHYTHTYAHAHRSHTCMNIHIYGIKGHKHRVVLNDSADVNVNLSVFFMSLQVQDSTRNDPGSILLEQSTERSTLPQGHLSGTQRRVWYISTEQKKL